MASQIRQIFYVSAAEGLLSPDIVNRILHASRRNNDKADVTGCLLFTGRTFAQVLEGRPETVQPLAAKIGADARHGRLRVLATQDVDRRSYGSWSMGYLYNLDLEDELRGLLDSPCSAEQVHRLMRQMQPDALAGAL